MADSSLKRKSDEFKQHVVFTDDELLKKIKLSKNVNTEKSEKKAHKVFTNFLNQIGATEVDYWSYEEPELDNYLAKFWLGVRKYDCDLDTEDSQDSSKEKIEKLYSANTLRNFRYALNRILKNRGHLYDITTKGASFMKSDEAFKVALNELKEQGKAEVHSHPEIGEEGK